MEEVLVVTVLDVGGMDEVLILTTLIPVGEVLGAVVWMDAELIVEVVLLFKVDEELVVVTIIDDVLWIEDDDKTDEIDVPEELEVDFAEETVLDDELETMAATW